MIEKTSQTVQTAASAIRQASAKTGMDFDYLMKTAARESSFNPMAKAGTSSAAGLFQFVEQTWLGTVKQHGADHGLGAYADQITQNKNGRYVVADRQVRADILALRFDADISATMAAEFTKDSQTYLTRNLGRQVSGGELYAAHFLGPQGAVDLIKASQTNTQTAAAIFPDAAKANKSIFYTKSGAARSPSEVLAVLDSKHNNVDLPEAPSVASGVMLAKLRPSVDTDPTSTPITPSTETVVASTAPAAGGVGDYTSATSATVMTPFIAQLLASLDPIPAEVRDSLFRTEQPQERRAYAAA